MGVDFDLLQEFSRHSVIFDRLLDENLMSCYQNAIDLLCSVFIPKCDPLNKTVKHVCRETCQDFQNACYDHVFNILRNTKLKWLQKNLAKQAKTIKSMMDSLHSLINCKYLP